MRFDFQALKARARQSIHDAMSSPASIENPTTGEVYSEYTDPESGVLTQLTVRWHNRIDRMGDLNREGYSVVLEGIDRLIFNIPQLTLFGIEPQRDWVVTMLGPNYHGAKLTLHSRESTVGPVESVWVVSHDEHDNS